MTERPHLLDSTLLPVMTVRDSALQANIDTMASFCIDHGLQLAPHMKTHMAPTIAVRQIAAGAWGVTVASVAQAKVAWEAGIHRIMIANEVLDSVGLAWLAEAAASPGADVDVLHWVDSLEGITKAALLGARHVLIDLGLAEGRNGVRTPVEAEQLARLAHDVGLNPRGVAGYEGGLHDLDLVHAYVTDAWQLHLRLLEDGVFGTDPIFTMGGSAYFDIVADAIGPSPDSTRVLLRSGAYVAHDDGAYARKTPFTRIPGQLEPALHVWAHVTSVPEPGLALVAMGKRDAPYDEGLPVPQLVIHDGVAETVPLSSCEVTKMDDQHGYVRFTRALSIRPGDVIRFGISHPCTAFDKWRSLPLLDDDDRIIDTIDTYF